MTQISILGKERGVTGAQGFCPCLCLQVGAIFRALPLQSPESRRVTGGRTLIREDPLLSYCEGKGGTTTAACTRWGVGGASGQEWRPPSALGVICQALGAPLSRQSSHSVKVLNFEKILQVC